MGQYYKEFYKTTPEVERELVAILGHRLDGPELRKDLEKRLRELKGIPKQRCVVSAAQAEFLERVLAMPTSDIV